MPEEITPEAIANSANSNTLDNDLEIQNSALKELLGENKKTMEALRAELDSVKKTNAKLLAQLDVAPKKASLEENLLAFNRYARKDK